MAQWADELALIACDSDETNDNGFCVEDTDAARTVFCNLKSVSTSEFYKSQQAGYKVEHKAEVYTCDYNQEEYAEMQGKRFKVVKTYTPPDTDITELTLGTLNAGTFTAGGE